MTTAGSLVSEKLPVEPAAPRLPGNAPAELAPYVAARVITPNDVTAVAMLVEMARRESASLAVDLRSWLGMGLAVRTPLDGHTCVDFAAISEWCAAIDLSAEDHLAWPCEAADWTRSLEAATPLVGPPGSRSPFILDGTRLYLEKSFREEQAIGQRLTGPDADRIEILLGGPGTGKTTCVATRLIELIRDNPESPIALAAPTGKAAARMAEALKARLHDANGPAEIREASQDVRDKVAAVRPVTIHKLLGYRPHGTPRYTFHSGNQLDTGLIVIDEASMLSSAMMAHLLAAVSSTTRLLLVGDPNQLASVDAGTVLGDIARAAALPGSPLASRTHTLTVRHRFGPRIGALADAILVTDRHGTDCVFEILEGRSRPPIDTANTKPDDPQSIHWIEPHTPAYHTLVSTVVEHATRCRVLARERAVGEALTALKKLQVLCAHRDGGMGVAGWNARVEKGLGVGPWNPWYSGRPVMVTRNTPSLDLFNGDVGIAVAGEEAGLRAVAFPLAGGELRFVPASQLEDVDTVHALTIHKSQGSEYEHVVVVLPSRPSRVLTRELLYTAVTRAAERVTIVGSREVITAALNKPIRRATGLAERL